ncbi:threonine/serine dehydratase (plasmid) [Mesorhizobium sp. B2-1-8]|uniref:threonine ammonia-lyase n=1 Tax=unclassified Mesorhizobium TaxID=325217 RepID=UPI00112E3B90|nr:MULTISPECIES: threonine/serine dehydratase [unclassified Mesorhizobium]MBZ9710395.1 threonine/serine dehydratase [Mesorhizobium sp. ESP7-2]UCI22688.1 threonine/serine dehydratase [Mesorhizobium sp. B2-1-8]
MIALEDIRAAAARIEGNIRRTPMIAGSNFKTPLAGDVELMLKLELLQVTGSFKARGATNKLLSLDRAMLTHGIVTASGGNHGIATARAGLMAGVQTTIFLPTNASPAKIEKLQAWGAATHIVGSAWHESNEAAQAFVRETGAVYFHPFADPAVVAGQGTVGLEILHQMPDVTTVLVAMGGGGLISGVATAIKALAPHIRVVGVEAAGSPVLLRALEAGRNVALDKVTTSVATMACAKTDDRIFDIVSDKVDEIVLVDDDEMLRAAKGLWFEMGLAADLSGAAAIAAIAEGRVRLNASERICAIVCGAGPDAIRG